MRPSLKRKLTIVATVLAAAAFAGGAFAATQTTGPSMRQAFLQDFAKRLNVTAGGPREQKILARMAKRVDALVNH